MERMMCRKMLSGVEEDVFFLVGELNSLVSRIKNNTLCAQKIRKEIMNWYISLPPDVRDEVNMVQIPEEFQGDIKNILQHALVTDVEFFNDFPYLYWDFADNGTSNKKLKILHRGSLKYDNIEESRCQLSERILLEFTKITWLHSKPIDIRLFHCESAPVNNIIPIMDKISMREVFSSEPSHSFNVSKIKWLQSKSCFTFSQFVVALWELRLWSCYQYRKNLASYLSTVDVKGKCTLDDTMKNIVLQHKSDMPNFIADIQSKSNEILRELTCDQNKTVPLYLSIMKKRFKNWKSYSELPPTETYCKRLWILNYFSTLLGVLRPALCPGKPLPKEIINRTFSETATAEIIRNLISVPLLDSFSLIHEFRLLVRDGLVADYHSTGLLESFEGEIKLIPEKVSKKKRSKKKRNKKRHVSPIEKSCSIETEKTIENEKSKECNESTFALAFAPRDVPSNVIISTQKLVFISQIIEAVVEDAFVQASQKAVCGQMSSSTPLPHSEAQNILVGSPLATNDEPGGQVQECFADGGCYDSMYALPSWVHADFEMDDDHSASISLDYFDNRFESNGNIRSNVSGDSRRFFSTTSSKVSNLSSVYWDAPSLHSGQVKLDNTSTNDEFSVSGTIDLEQYFALYGDVNHSEENQTGRSRREMFVDTDTNEILEKGDAGRLIFHVDETIPHISIPMILEEGEDVAVEDSLNCGIDRKFNAEDKRIKENVAEVTLTDVFSVEDYVRNSANQKPPLLLSGIPAATSESNRKNTGLRLSGMKTSADNRVDTCPPRPRTASLNSRHCDMHALSMHPSRVRGRSLSPTQTRINSSLRDSSVIMQQRSKNAAGHMELSRNNDDCSPAHQLNTSHTSIDGLSATSDDSDNSPQIPRLQVDGITKSPGMLVMALAFTNMKAQADSMVLRNIVALQRSLILFPNAGLIGQPSQHPVAYSELNIRSNTNDLEVMSDDGNHTMSSHRSIRIATGTATVSSLVFNKNMTKQEPAVPVTLQRSTSMRSVPSSPREQSSHAPAHHFDIFPPLPAAYPSAYVNSQQQLQQQPQQYAYDDEAVPYSNRLRKSISFSSTPKSEEGRKKEKSIPRHSDQDWNGSSHRPRSASVSRHQQDHHSIQATFDDYNASKIDSISSKENIQGTIFLTSEQPHPLHPSQSATKDEISNKSLYYPISYAIFSQGIFNQGGIGMIPTPLTREIFSFVERVDAFGAKMQSAKATAILRLRQVVQQLWPRAQVHAFGSYVTGLSLPSSDLDLVICLPQVHHVAGPSAPGFLEGRNAIKETWQKNLARCLSKESWVDVSSMKVIGNTAIPVIKLNTCSESGFHVSLDISFSAHGHQGLQASKMNIALMREYPSLRLIVLVLKQFLTRRGLCEVFTGGMSSYAILLLTVRYLQEQPVGSNNDIGASLLGLLDFYGNHLRPSVTGISVADKCYFSRQDNNEVVNINPYSRSTSSRRHSFREYQDNPNASSMNDNYRPYKFDPLFIEDPLDKGNNVGRNCFRIHQVQRLFSDVHKSIMDNITNFEMCNFRDYEAFSLLKLLVGDDESLLAPVD